MKLLHILEQLIDTVSLFIKRDSLGVWKWGCMR